MRRVLLTGVFSFLLAACSGPSLEPLSIEGRGLTALSWGMSPDSARARMAELDGVVFVSDTVIKPYERWWFISPESVAVGMNGRYPFLRHRFGGGTFIGYDVASWELYFREGERLEEVRILTSGDLGWRDEFSLLNRRLTPLYGQMIYGRGMIRSGANALDPFTFGGKGQFVTLGWRDSVDRMDYLNATGLLDFTTKESMSDPGGCEIEFRYYDRRLRDEEDDLAYNTPHGTDLRRYHVSEVDTSAIRSMYE